LSDATQSLVHLGDITMPPYAALMLVDVDEEAKAF
jgi:hypothetical protein